MTIFVPDVYAICTPSYVLSTQPLLPNNTLATGYVNFTLKACLEVPRNLSCRWEYGLSAVQFYSGDGGCSQLNSSDYMITCSLENKINKTKFERVRISVIDTSFTLLVPVSTTNSRFALSCIKGIRSTLGRFIESGSIYLPGTAIVQSKLYDNANTAMFYVLC